MVFTLQLLMQYPQQVVESRVESVVWKERMAELHWWRRHNIFSLKRGSLLTVHEEQQ